VTNDPKPDPLWYDRTEPDTDPGPWIWLLAALFVSGRALLYLPGFVYERCASWVLRRRRS
jgi:hypothetical protein